MYLFLVMLSHQHNSFIYFTVVISKDQVDNWDKGYYNVLLCNNVIPFTLMFSHYSLVHFQINWILHNSEFMSVHDAQCYPDTKFSHVRSSIFEVLSQLPQT